MTNPSVKELWEKLGPNILPDFTSDQVLVQAFHDGTITLAEFKRLDADLKRRQSRLFAQYPQHDDD
jgi:hypothetical protein